MSSTVRVFVNDKRIATGKVWKGQFLQVYPEKKTFNSEGEWRTAIYESLIPTIKFITTEEKKVLPKKRNEVIVPKSHPVPVKPEPAPVAEVSNPTSKAVLNPESEDEKEVEDQNWFCGYCRLPPGNDHRMCICKGYNYSVKAWEEGRIFSKKDKNEKETNAPVSYNSKDWKFKNIKKATFPPGTYYIGDLCYALDDRLYDRVFGEDYDSGYYSQKNNSNHMFMLSDTGIGDGCFKGTDKHEYCVDAGILGIASESVLDPEKAPYEGGKMHTFKGNVSVCFEPYKVFKFLSDTAHDESICIYISEEDDYDSDYDSSYNDDY